MNNIADRDFAEKLIIITGGTSGIGFALAEDFCRRHAKVVVVADRPEGVERTIQHFAKQGKGVDGYVCDVGSADGVAETSKMILAKHGVPDILVNNAGFATYRTFEQEDPDEIERLMDVNFGGAVRMSKAFIGGMNKRRSGHIVNIASIAGAITLTPNSLYCGAKHALMAWSKCLSIELARFGVAVTVICPGRVLTNFFAHETFQTRSHRPETSLTVPMSAVVQATVEAIRRRQFIRFVPRYLGAITWASAAFGPLAQRPLNSLMRSRIEDLYRDQARR